MLSYMVLLPNGERIYVSRNNTKGPGRATVRKRAFEVAERTGGTLYRECLENIMLNELEYKEHWVRDDEVPL